MSALGLSNFLRMVGFGIVVFGGIGLIMALIVRRILAIDTMGLYVLMVGCGGMVRVMHVALVLFFQNTIVFVSLSRCFSFSSSVPIGWLSLSWNHFREFDVLTVMEHLRHLWLHLEDQIVVFNGDLGGSEGRRVCIEGCVVTLVPSFGIKSGKVVPPVEVKARCLRVPSIGLYIVVLDVPGHIDGIEALAPRLESWRPEIHHDGLSSAHIVN